MEIRGKIVVKAGNGKGFKVSGNDNWFNATDAVVPVLAQLNKGDDVVVTYEAKGVKQTATKIDKIVAEVSKPVTTSVASTSAPVQKSYQKPYTSEYNSAERQAAIQRGNALNAAAALYAGRPEDPEILAEITLAYAQKFLDWLRVE